MPIARALKKMWKKHVMGCPHAQDFSSTTSYSTSSSSSPSFTSTTASAGLSDLLLIVFSVSVSLVCFFVSFVSSFFICKFTKKVVFFLLYLNISDLKT